MGHRTVDLVVDYLHSLPEERVARRATAEQLAVEVDESLPLAGRGVEDSLRFFSEHIVPGMTRVNPPRFHAYIPGPSSFYGVLGELLSAGTNPFVGSWLGGASVSSLELTVLRWIAEAVGYPGDAAGLLTSGGSMANLSALAAARERFGSETSSRGVLYFSEQGHASAEKAARVLGFPPVALRRIGVDSRYRFDLKALRVAVAQDRGEGLLPFWVCATAGTTNTGSIDPLPQMADFCASEGLWFHVDAAYGGFAAICESGRQKLVGMERADSLTLDPHKWLYAPMGTGCVLVRDREALENAFRAEGDYLKDVPRDEVNFFDRGPELSRPGRALGVWMLLRSAGLDALAHQVEADLDLAQTAQEMLAHLEGLEIVCPAELSVVTFRHTLAPGESEADRAARDTELMEKTLEEGDVMISSTLLDDRSALRFVVQNHRTTAAEIRRSIEAIRRNLVAGQPSPNRD